MVAGRISSILVPHIVNFNHVINLTAHHVGFYDTSGNIAICDPGCHADLLQSLTSDTMVIVENNADIKNYSIPDENAVLVDSFSTGRLGIRVSRLIRPKDKANVSFTPVDKPVDTFEVYHV